jgi:hypothetical protein
MEMIPAQLARVCASEPTAMAKPAPATIATCVDRGFSGRVTMWTIKVNYELLTSDRNVAILRDYVGPRFGVVRIVVIGILSGYPICGC